MPIIDIPASEISVSDIIGEGMRIWLTAKGGKNVTIYWGPNDASLMSGRYQDEAHRIIYKPNDIVRVIRG